jgi:uncharacterized protein (TIGR00251 family)
LVKLVRINVRVIPRSSKNSIEWDESGLRVRLTAPPVDGAANVALIAFLAQYLGMHTRDIRIVQGMTSRHKIVEITGMTTEVFEKRIKGK